MILSICILTYNRAPEMERLLNSLAPQITDEVELVIRDDSTNNDTKLLVERFSKLIPIRYFHGEKGGIDKTIIFLTQEARGEFVWWLGDDEVVPGGVGAVIEVIKQNRDVTFIWANYRLENSVELAIDLYENRFFDNRDELLELGGAGLGFVSATIFKRNLALLGIERSKKYIGSLFVNLYLVLYVISRPGKYYHIQSPIVICYPTMSDEIKSIVVQSDGEIINRGFEVYGIIFPNIVREFSGIFSQGAVRRTIKNSFGHTWRGMLVAWVGGWDTPSGKRWEMFKHYWNFPEFWVAIPFFMMPLWLNKLLYKIYKIFFRHRKFILMD